MPHLHRRLTVADVLAMPDDGCRHELINGELVVSPAPSLLHQRVIVALLVRLDGYVRNIGAEGTALTGPADISWDDDNLVQPDILVIYPDDLARTWSEIRRLRLVVEVISPSSRRRDRVDKRVIYTRNKVETYWIVDPDAAIVEVWTPGDDRPLIATDILVWRPAPDLPELAIDLAIVFPPSAGPVPPHPPAA